MSSTEPGPGRARAASKVLPSAASQDGTGAAADNPGTRTGLSNRVADGAVRPGDVSWSAPHVPALDGNASLSNRKHRLSRESSPSERPAQRPWAQAPLIAPATTGTALRADLNYPVGSLSHARGPRVSLSGYRERDEDGQDQVSHYSGGGARHTSPISSNPRPLLAPKPIRLPDPPGTPGRAATSAPRPKPKVNLNLEHPGGEHRAVPPRHHASLPLAAPAASVLSSDGVSSVHGGSSSHTVHAAAPHAGKQAIRSTETRARVQSELTVATSSSSVPQYRPHVPIAPAPVIPQTRPMIVPSQSPRVHGSDGAVTRPVHLTTASGSRSPAPSAAPSYTSAAATRTNQTYAQLAAPSQSRASTAAAPRAPQMHTQPTAASAHQSHAPHRAAPPHQSHASHAGSQSQQAPHVAPPPTLGVSQNPAAIAYQAQIPGSFGPAPGQVLPPPAPPGVRYQVPFMFSVPGPVQPRPRPVPIPPGAATVIHCVFPGCSGFRVWGHEIVLARRHVAIVHYQATLRKLADLHLHERGDPPVIECDFPGCYDEEFPLDQRGKAQTHVFVEHYNGTMMDAAKIHLVVSPAPSR